MNKDNLVECVQLKTGLPKRQAKESVEAVISSIKEALATGEKVSIVEFGTFSIASRAERNGINPKTKEPLSIPACEVPIWKASPKYKETFRQYTIS